MSKKLLIHIGAPKTGTSAFQRSLQHDRVLYHDLGIDECPLFFGSVGFGSRRDAVAGHTDFFAALRNPALTKWRDSLFKTAFGESKYEKFIISDEHLSKPSNLLNQTDFKFLLNYVDKVVVLYFVREPLVHAWSFYKEFSSWPDFTAVDFEHFLRFEYAKWIMPSHTINHYSNIQGIDFRVRLYPKDCVSECVLQEFEIKSAEGAFGKVEQVYPSLPDEWMETYTAHAQTMRGEAKTRFNHALPDFIEALPELPLKYIKIRYPESVQRQRDFLVSSGVLKLKVLRPLTLPKFQDSALVHEKLRALSRQGHDQSGKTVLAPAPNQASGIWCMATLVKAGDTALERYVQHHLQFDFLHLLIFLDGTVHSSVSDFGDERIQTIACPDEYWQAQGVDGDIDSKILHCHQVTRDFCKQHGIEWYFHNDVDELLSSSQQERSVGAHLETVTQNVNEIRVNPFEVSFIYEINDLRLVRAILKRPTVTVPDISKLARAILVNLQRLTLLFYRPALSMAKEYVASPNAATPSNKAGAKQHTVSRLASTQTEQRTRRQKVADLTSHPYDVIELTFRRCQRQLASVFIKGIILTIDIQYALRMHLGKRNFEHRQRLLPTKAVINWYSKVLGTYSSLTTFGFAAHQAGKSFRRVSRDTWADNSHSALYKFANGKKLPLFPNLILIHDDCRNLEHWREKFQSRVYNPYLSKEMGLRRKIQATLIAAEPTDEFYFRIYGIPGEYAEEGLRRGYLVEVPEDLTLYDRK
jgi:hypothetical protein